MSKKRGGRPVRSHLTSHEHLFKRRIIVNCPVSGHKRGEIFQDVAHTEVWPDHLEDDGDPRN